MSADTFSGDESNEPKGIFWSASLSIDFEDDKESPDQDQSKEQEKALSQSNKAAVEPASEKTSTQLFFMHLRLLLWKNYKLFSRNLKLTCFQLATPVFFCLLIVYLQWLADSFTTMSLPNPSRDVGPMNKCRGDGCITIGYGIIVIIFLRYPQN